MESHTRQAICFNYGNHFILFSNTCRELRATAGQNRMWKPLGRDRERPREAWLVLEVTCHRVWGGGGGGGPEVPGKGPGCKGGSDTCHALVTQGPHGSWHKRDHILILPDIRQLPRVPLLCGIQPQKRNSNRQTPRLTLPTRRLMTRWVLGRGWVPRMFWALHYLTMSYMELGFKTSWLNVPFIFNFFF